jgi:hypothetical protein
MWTAGPGRIPPESSLKLRGGRCATRLGLRSCVAAKRDRRGDPFSAGY